MDLRQLYPVALGVIAIIGTVAALWVVSGDGVLGGSTWGAGGPGAAQTGPAAGSPGQGYACTTSGEDEVLRLSQPSGFYDEPIEVEVVAPRGVGTIYYTLDGSYPDPDANAEATEEYDRPLTITDRTGEPNQLAQFRSAFDRDLVSRGRMPDEIWSVTDDDIQKGTPVRLRTIDGPECAAVFFVGEDLRRSVLPVTTISTDPDHLFDHDIGIYTSGRTLEEWIDSDEFSRTTPLHEWGTVPQNPWQRGREWERPHPDELERATILHHFEPGGELAYARDVGIRIHGGWTRAFPQKSLRLYARNDYGSRTFEYPFWGDDAKLEQRRIVLRNSGNDWDWTLMLDGYMQSLVHHLDLDTQAYQPTVVFLNGEYWGIHNLRQRYDRHYLELQHGVDPDNVTIVEGPDACCQVATGDPEDGDPFLELLDELQAMDPTSDEMLEHAAAHIDLDDLMEYLVVQVYTSNTDWPQNNVRMWREKVPPDASAGDRRDGRWRWLLFDLDFVGDLARNPFHDALARLEDLVDPDDVAADMGIPFLLDHLAQHEGFRNDFISLFADQLNTSFREDRALAMFEEAHGRIEAEMPHHIHRWGGVDRYGWWAPVSLAEWNGHIAGLRDFVQTRPATQRVHLAERFDLGDTADTGSQAFGRLTVLTDADAGHVTVNTIDLVADTPGVEDPGEWTGVYFREVPVTLQAKPADGQRFVRWEGVPDELAADERIELHLDASSQEVTAVFEAA